MLLGAHGRRGCRDACGALFFGPVHQQIERNLIAPELVMLLQLGGLAFGVALLDGGPDDLPEGCAGQQLGILALLGRFLGGLLASLVLTGNQ